MRRLAGQAGRWLSRHRPSAVVAAPSTAIGTARAGTDLPLTTAHGGRSRSRLRYLDVESPPAATRLRRPRRAWLALLALPLALTAAYLVFVASDRYSSQTSFVIREGGLGSASTAGGGLARNDDSSHAIVAYFRSRAAAEDLAERMDLRAIFGRPEGDVLTRFPRPFSGDTSEALHRHLQDAIDIELDTRSGITSLDIVAYRPQDARAIADALLDEAESLVNAMNVRASEDAIAFAQSLVTESEVRVRDVQRRLSDFRNSRSVLDPNVQSAAQFSLMAELTRGATALDTEIAQLRSSAARSPRLQNLVERRSALGTQIEGIRVGLAGSSTSLAPQLSNYEMLALERELAVKSLTAGYRTLEQARQEAAAGRLYLQRISAPHLADRPSHPRTLRILLIVLATTLGLFWILRFLARVTMEHRF